MERIEALISRLKEQFEQHAGAAQMLVTVQLLESELAKMRTNGQQSLGTSKVSVVMPRTASQAIESDYRPAKEEKTKEEPVQEAAAPEKFAAYKPAVKPEPAEMGYDPLVEIPTLSHQKGVQEVNESVTYSESLNDRLKESRVEVVEMLKDSPVRDLRKAVGINDRFVFISELFRGDEAMYERSIKTINGFDSYSEAEYWINRELKTKIGWDDRKDIVQHFYQLVRRRFS